MCGRRGAVFDACGVPMRVRSAEVYEVDATSPDLSGGVRQRRSHAKVRRAGAGMCDRP